MMHRAAAACLRVRAALPRAHTLTAAHARTLATVEYKVIAAFPGRFAAKKKTGSSVPSVAPPAETAGADEDAAGAAEDAAAAPKDVRSLMAKHVDYAKRELSKLRGATANPAMLDNVRVDAYGDVMPLSGLAQVVLKTPQLLIVNPFDASLASTIADAIRDADLNLNPAVDGNVVRVPVPKSSKETREATVKLISKIAETAKTRIRRVRQAAMDKLKKMEGVSPDDTFREIKEIQAMTNAATDEVSKLAEKKKLEVEQA